jgi:hypothetical protein
LILTIGIIRVRLNSSDMWIALVDRCWGVHLIIPNRHVWSPWESCIEEPNGSISWGLLFKPHGRLKLTLLAICIDIATLWA